MTVTVPGFLAVTTPLALISATDVSSTDHATLLSDTFAGVTSAVSATLERSLTSTEAAPPLIATTASILLTVTLTSAVLPPSAVTVITAVPALTAVITPSLTVATDESDVDHVTS